jgi:hypothetical protein
MPTGGIGPLDVLLLIIALIGGAGLFIELGAGAVEAWHRWF